MSGGFNSTYRLLKPFVYETHIMRLNYQPRRGTPVEYASRFPEVCGEADVIQAVHSNEAFIVGWKECHWDSQIPWMNVQSVQGEVPREVHVTKEHVINRTIMDAIAYQLESDPRDTYMLRSYEKILTDLGWKYNKRPTGWVEVDGEYLPDEDPGYVIPESIQEKVLQQREFQYVNAMLKANGGQPLTRDIFATPTTVEEPSITKVEYSKGPSLEEQVAALAQQVAALTGILTQNATAINGTGHSEQRPFGVEQEQIIGADGQHL